MGGEGGEGGEGGWAWWGQHGMMHISPAARQAFGGVNWQLPVLLVRPIEAMCPLCLFPKSVCVCV